MSLRELTEAAARQCERPLLLLLDQFEEYLILASPEIQAGFRAWVADLAARPIGNLKLLLALRDEYTTDLEKVGFPPPAYKYNWIKLDCFSHRAAHDFLKGGLNLNPTDMDSLLTSAADIDGIPGKVKPITLNVLGHVLEEGGAVASGLDAGRLIRRYIDQVIGKPGVRAHAAPVLDQLITPHGTKRPRAEAELAEATRLSIQEVRAVLRGLHQAWLARPLDAASQVWELSHDFIAQAVSTYLGRQPLRFGRQALTWAGPALLGGLIALLGARQLNVWLETRPLDPEMVEIPAGSFCMGSRLPKTPAPADCPDLPVDDEANGDETPARRVSVPAFRLGKHEVTAGEYRRFVKAMQAEGKELIWNDDTDTVHALPLDQRDQKDRLPAVNVSFEDASAYAAWLSLATGQPEEAPYRLPTEAEWEYAARAPDPGKPVQKRRWWGNDTDHRQACKHANVLDRKGSSFLDSLNYIIDWANHDCEDAYALSAPAGRFGANAFQLEDMLGNVSEWVADCYHDSYWEAPPDPDAWMDGAYCADGRRVLRGGSWFSNPKILRSASRLKFKPGFRYDTIGFRLAQDLK
jgi:formylglycine-generating enzyme required for sulfatase activity